MRGVFPASRTYPTVGRPRRMCSGRRRYRDGDGLRQWFGASGCLSPRSSIVEKPKRQRRDSTSAATGPGFPTRSMFGRFSVLISPRERRCGTKRCIKAVHRRPFMSKTVTPPRRPPRMASACMPASAASGFSPLISTGRKSGSIRWSRAAPARAGARRPRPCSMADGCITSATTTSKATCSRSTS